METREPGEPLRGTAKDGISYGLLEIVKALVVMGGVSSAPPKQVPLTTENMPPAERMGNIRPTQVS